MFMQPRAAAENNLCSISAVPAPVRFLANSYFPRVSRLSNDKDDN